MLAPVTSLSCSQPPASSCCYQPPTSLSLCVCLRDSENRDAATIIQSLRPQQQQCTVVQLYTHPVPHLSVSSLNQLEVGCQADGTRQPMTTPDGYLRPFLTSLTHPSCIEQIAQHLQISTKDHNTLHLHLNIFSKSQLLLCLLGCLIEDNSSFMGFQLQNQL